MLVKLLDAGQRLPVHVHPTRPFAREHLHSCYGKSEAWYVLETHGDDPAVWVGFREDVDPAVLAERVDAQDSAWMLAHLNKISVRPGDGIVVPAGQAHATGAGVFLVEVQEPTDFSILLEWSVTTATRDESHLGLGFDVVLPAVSHRALTAARAVACTSTPRAGRRADARAAEAADPYFRLDVAAPPGSPVTVPQGYAVAIVLADGAIGWADGAQDIARGRRLRRARRDRRLGGDRGGQRGGVQAGRGLARGGRLASWRAGPGRHDDPRGLGAARRPGLARGRPHAPLRVQRAAGHRRGLPPRWHGQPAGRHPVAGGATRTRPDVVVGEIMSPDVLWIRPSAKLTLVAHRMRTYGELRVMPIVERGVLVGVVTRADLLRPRPPRRGLGDRAGDWVRGAATPTSRCCASPARRGPGPPRPTARPSSA